MVFINEELFVMEALEWFGEDLLGTEMKMHFHVENGNYNLLLQC